MPSQPVNRLFHDKTLNNALQGFGLPFDLSERQQKIVQWIEPLAKGVFNEIKEVSLHGQFLSDVFQQR